MRTFFILCIGLTLVLWTKVSSACEFCTIAYLGKRDSRPKDQKHTWTAKVLYEDQDWKEISAAQAHTLHHQGHHTHDKQDEQIIHTMLSVKPMERMSFDIDIPYVTRHYIEIDSHAQLGRNETSQGLGDITLTGNYQLIENEKKSFGLIAGVKLPSGETKELDSGGGRMEPELQPGTGSIDYIAGLTGSFYPNDWDFSTNAIYIYKTEGAQDFRHGDVLSISLFAGKQFELNKKSYLTPGVMINNQLEKKQNNNDGSVKDSGGYTMFIGPQVKLDYQSVSVDFSYLSPAVQELGGMHQKLNGIWTSSLNVRF